MIMKQPNQESVGRKETNNLGFKNGFVGEKIGRNYEYNEENA